MNLAYQIMEYVGWNLIDMFLLITILNILDLFFLFFLFIN